MNCDTAARRRRRFARFERYTWACFFNVVVIALVTLAAIKIAAVTLGLSPLQTVLVAGAVTVTFSALGGFLGVVITDLILFVVSMAGAIAAAWVVVNLPEVGGLGNLLANPAVSSRLQFFPDFSDLEITISILVIPLAVKWWSVWYPGSEPGGGGYVAQRMLAAKSERDATGAVVAVPVGALRHSPWPWIVVALASLVVFPDLVSCHASSDASARPTGSVARRVPAGMVGSISKGRNAATGPVGRALREFAMHATAALWPLRICPIFPADHALH